MLGRGRKPKSIAYNTSNGIMFHGKSDLLLKNHPTLLKHKGEIQLIFTSPPFPLNRKKKYGNLQGKEYIDWLSKIYETLTTYLKNDGSIVIELGNSWEPGLPTMSTLALETLLAIKERNDLHLCQEFICHNPARLPSPAQWVTIERIRLKDSFTRLWWLSPSTKPKADNRKVLKEYSKSMKDLLKSKKYNSGKRPSEHIIGDNSFLNNNGGSIHPNVLTISNTISNDEYINYCKNNNIQLHPARMPKELASFFIQFLTDENDIVLDPFAGSNITGATAEYLNRKWLSIEMNNEYISGSRGRFDLLQKNTGTK